MPAERIGTPRPAVPDALLTPLVESAAETLRALEANDVPASLRHLHGFDKRGLMHGPGPRQLRRAFDEDAAFRERVVARFEALGPVAALLDEWVENASWELVEASAARGELALLASVLWGCRPVGADFGLGLIVAIDARDQRDHDQSHAARAQGREVTELVEAKRRADTARAEAQTEAARLIEELRKERHSRRRREEQADADARAAHRRAEDLEVQLRETSAEVEQARARLAREGQRARAVEDDLRRSRAEIAELTARLERTPSRLAPSDARSLADAIASLQRLTGELAALRARINVRAVPEPATTSEPPRRRDRVAPLAGRVAPTLPAGVIASSIAGIEAMLKSSEVLLVVDGYNVTKRGWPDAGAADQRERLGIALTQLHRRLGCRVLCVFDGDGSGPLAATARPGGIRVVFSEADEEADEVVVREVEDQPKRIPVVVVSSDAWVREHAEAAGAVVVPADALLTVLRR